MHRPPPPSVSFLSHLIPDRQSLRLDLPTNRHHPSFRLHLCSLPSRLVHLVRLTWFAFPLLSVQSLSPASHSSFLSSCGGLGLSDSTLPAQQVRLDVAELFLVPTMQIVRAELDLRFLQFNLAKGLVRGEPRRPHGNLKPNMSA